MNQLPVARTLFASSVPRRSFLRFAGLAAVSTVISQRTFAQANPGVSLGTQGTAVLNYAFALEQLEAEFYSIAMQHPYAGMNSRERQVLSDIREHERAHVDFYRAKLGGAGIPKLQFNFGAVNFGDRISVLTTARTFEDTGVSAYNGAGQLLRDPHNLAIAVKIVSVWSTLSGSTWLIRRTRFSPR